MKHFPLFIGILFFFLLPHLLKLRLFRNDTRYTDLSINIIYDSNYEKNKDYCFDFENVIYKCPLTLQKMDHSDPNISFGLRNGRTIFS